MNRETRAVGCLLGLALGDACGAPYEGGIVERTLWRLLRLPGGATLRWSDDTQMALVLAESLSERGGVDGDHLARRWAAEAEWSRGYGPGTWKVLGRIRGGEPWRRARFAANASGSWGNGAAMRVAPLGVFYSDRPEEALRRAAEEAAAVTHAHPLAIEGAVLIARAAALLVREPFDPKQFMSALAAGVSPDFSSALSPQAPTRMGTAAVESVPAALRAFCRYPRNFDALIADVIAAGGDTDTIAAMAGALFGALNGPEALPPALLSRLEARERIITAGRALASSPTR